MRIDYYQLLDVAENAGVAEIKAAYRTQAKRFHPDRNVGNPAAEERFKLVSEAYRVLGNRERRAEYDSWLERQKRLASAPELASMPKRTRFSYRHSQERRERRRHARRAHPPRPFLIKPRSNGEIARFIFFYALCIFCLAPWFISYMNRGSHTETAARPGKTEPGVSPLDDETQIKKLADFTESIRRQAYDGIPDAQCRYGSFLFHGTGGLKQDRAAAMEWWRKAAAQGYHPAEQYLKKNKGQQPKPPPETPPAH